MILIGGAGLTGMVLGWELAKRRIPFLILEKEERPGGLLRTEKKGKYRFDYTGHLLHFSDERAENFVKRELKLELYKHRRHSFIHLETGLVPYPFQYHLYYLPGHLRNRAVSEFIKARTQNKTAGNFYDWIYSSFGKGIAELFMVPYNKKLWKYDLRKLGINWMGRFVPPAASSVL
ncbi:MAG TPA: NAD(P)-binding protein, partial [bacterium]|nr:NAD(P)-binding protein [bacterium]